MLRIVEAIMGLELCEQSCAPPPPPPMICQHPPSEIMKIRPWSNYLSIGPYLPFFNILGPESGASKPDQNVNPLGGPFESPVI